MSIGIPSSQPIPTTSSVGGAFQVAAQNALKAAEAKAKDLAVAMNITVIDRFGNLAAFERMDGAWIGSIDISMKKALCARSFDMPSATIGGLSQPGGSLYKIEVSNGGLITFGGGLPISSGGTVVGAIGVSGGSVAQDVEVAEAGKTAFEAAPPPAPPTISIEQARAVVKAGLAASLSDEAKAQNGDFGGCLMNIAVVDAGGKLMQFVRMDGAWLGSVDIAIKKAKTIAMFASVGKTGTIGSISQPGAELSNIEFSNAGLITFPGGVVIKDGDTVIGAVGVSGGSVEADQFVAEAAAAQKASDVHGADIAIGDNLKLAVKALGAGEEKARSLNAKMNISVSDAGGSLVAFTRMTDAWLGSADISVKKANMAVKFFMKSGAIGGLSDPSKPGESLYQIELSNGGLISFPGGTPVNDTDGKTVFGVGVSGSSVEDDQAVSDAAAAAMGTPQSEQALPVEKAYEIIAAAEAKAIAMGVNMDLCVVDATLDLVAFKRMNGAWRGSIDISQKKAKSAVMFGMNTEILGSISHAGQPLFGIEHSNNFAHRSDQISTNATFAGGEPGGLITFGGGACLKVGGKVVGGFGVSGSSVPDDMAVCQAGVAVCS